MLKVFVFLSILILFLGIFIVFFSDGNMLGYKAGTQISMINGKELSTKTFSMRQLDSLSAQFNLPFTENNINFIPKDLAFMNKK
jgi:hypothetical protein